MGGEKRYEIGRYTMTIELKIVALVGLLLGGVASAQSAEIQPTNLVKHIQSTAVQFTDNPNAPYSAVSRNGF